MRLFPFSSYSSVSSPSPASCLLPPAAHRRALTSCVLPACQVSSALAHLNTTPVWAESSRERRPGCIHKQPVTSSLSRWGATSHSQRGGRCPPPPPPSKLPKRSVFRRLGTFTSRLLCTYRHTHRVTILSKCVLQWCRVMLVFTPPSGGLLSLRGVIIWQPITGNVIFMNENKAEWLSEGFGEEEADDMLVAFCFIQIPRIASSFCGVVCVAVTPMSARPTDAQEGSSLCSV